MQSLKQSQLVSAFFITLGLLIGSSTTPPIADEIIAMLKQGNERFASGKPTYPHESLMRRAEVAAAQHPVATVIACSDSRVPPELLFDEGIGDLFLVRVIGNIGGADETGSAEYGVEHLGTPLLVVLGHSSCGAVTAAVNHMEVRGNIPPLLAHIKPAVQKALKAHPELRGNDLVPAAVEANVLHSMQELFARSEIIRARVRNNKLKVVGAIYDLKSGQVNWLGALPNQAALLASSPKRKVKTRE
jgi:carbonic anhydrase